MPQRTTSAAAVVGSGLAGRSRVRLTHPSGGAVEAYTHGGQVLTWRHPSGDVLFLSARADKHQEKHAGIPVIFPQFGHGFGALARLLPQHGFARDRGWKIAGRGVDSTGRAAATLTLAASPETRTLWPHEFSLELVVALGSDLSLTWRVTNHGTAPMPFTGGLHSYFRVRDVRTARIEGLQGLRYRDNTANWAESTESAAALVPDGETDRVYLGAPSRIRLRDGTRCIRLENTGFASVVVWNPGPGSDEKYDFAPGEWSQFVCIEPATVFEPITLQPDATWKGEHRIAVE